MAEEAPTILLVDDEPEILKSLERALRSVGTILMAQSGDEALKILGTTPIHIVLADQRMPVMSGVEFLKTVYNKYPHVVRIILTGYSDIADLIDAINEARIYRYLTKPWENKELQFVVKAAIDRFRLQQENQQLVNSLKEQNRRLADKEKELMKVNKDLERTVLERTREIRHINSKLQQIAVTDPLTKVAN
ncbi:MAG TPA: response regulator, partial [Bdellovibrionota bacterium]|nr:response regulator [Bdellovibrionota bacterium]